MFANNFEKKDSTFYCKKCKFLTITELFARAHARSCGRSSRKGRPQKLSPCLECGEEFSSLKDLKLHHRKEHVCGQYSCSKCLREFTHRPALFRHLKSHREPPKWSCPRPGCAFKCRYRSYLKRHAAVHARKEQQSEKVRFSEKFYIVVTCVGVFMLKDSNLYLC